MTCLPKDVVLEIEVHDAVENSDAKFPLVSVGERHIVESLPHKPKSLVLP